MGDVIIYEDLVIPELSLKFEKFIQQGGEAEIWRVKETSMLRRTLAAKVVLIPREARNSRENERRIRRIQEQEALNWSKVSKCEHVVSCSYPLETHTTIKGCEYILIGFAMPYAELGDLKKYLRNGEHLKLNGQKEKVMFLLNIASAIKFAHDVDVAHQDLKSDNILIFQDGVDIRPKIMDFGISISAETNSSACGTPEYLAPERFIRGRKFTVEEAKRSDVYSLGIVFYEIMCRKLPISAPHVSEHDRWDTYHRLHETVTPDFHFVVDQFGAKMGFLIEAMLAKDSLGRPEMFRVVTALEGIYREARSRETTQLENTDLIRADTYRWNKAIHEYLGNSLHFYLIHCESQISDFAWLRSNLTQEKIHGYALYRVLGEYDYLLRVWLKRTYEEAMERILAQFEGNLGGRIRTFHVRDMTLFQQSPRLALPKDNDQENLLTLLANCANENAETEFKNLRRRKYVTSRLSAGKSCQFIRFFATVKATQRIGDWKRDALASQFHGTLAKHPAVRDISVYRGEGDFSVLLKFRLEKFLEYRSVLDNLLACAAEARKDSVNVSVVTHVEVPGEVNRESDDGSVVREVSRSHFEATHQL